MTLAWHVPPLYVLLLLYSLAKHAVCVHCTVSGVSDYQ